MSEWNVGEYAPPTQPQNQQKPHPCRPLQDRMRILQRGKTLETTAQSVSDQFLARLCGRCPENHYTVNMKRRQLGQNEHGVSKGKDHLICGLAKKEDCLNTQEECMFFLNFIKAFHVISYAASL